MDREGFSQSVLTVAGNQWQWIPVAGLSSLATALGGTQQYFATANHQLAATMNICQDAALVAETVALLRLVRRLDSLSSAAHTVEL